MSRDRGDEGALLVQSILLVGVLAVIMMSLANWAVVGTRSSARSAAMLRASAAARAGFDFSVVQYSTDVWAACADVTALDVPASLSTSADTLTLTCAPRPELDGHPVVLVASQASSDGSVVTLKAEIQLERDTTGAAVLSYVRD